MLSNETFFIFNFESDVMVLTFLLYYVECSIKLNKLITPFFKVQQGRTGNSEKEAALPSTKAEFTSPPSLFKTGLPPSRLVRHWWFSWLKELVSLPRISAIWGRKALNDITKNWNILLGFSTKWILCEKLFWVLFHLKKFR